MSQVVVASSVKCAARMLLPKVTSTIKGDVLYASRRPSTCSMNNRDRQLPPTARWHGHRARLSIVTTRASAGESSEISGEREEDENQQESSTDAISADGTSKSNGENMDMRDFRRRLLAKGLDGWGVENNGEGNEGGEQATGDDERQGFRAASV